MGLRALLLAYELMRGLADDAGFPLQMGSLIEAERARTEAALAGAGIALKSLWDIRHLLAEGALVPVLDDYIAEPLWSLWAVRPQGQVVPARVRAFDFMEMKFRQLDN